MLSSRGHYRKEIIPLALHSDGTPVIDIEKIWSRLLIIFSFNSLLGHGATNDMEIHLGLSFDECCCPTAMDEGFTILIWSLEALQKGGRPGSNHFGRSTTQTLVKASWLVHCFQVGIQQLFGAWRGTLNT